MRKLESDDRTLRASFSDLVLGTHRDGHRLDRRLVVVGGVLVLFECLGLAALDELCAARPALLVERGARELLRALVGERLAALRAELAALAEAAAALAELLPVLAPLLGRRDPEEAPSR